LIISKALCALFKCKPKRKIGFIETTWKIVEATFILVIIIFFVIYCAGLPLEGIDYE